MNKLLKIIPLLLLISCSKNTFNGKYFQIKRCEPTTVKCEIINQEVLGAVTGVAADSLYIYYTLMNPEYRLAISDMNSNSIVDIASVGRGPNEYTMLNIYNRSFKEENNQYIWILDVLNNSADKLNVTQSFVKHKTIIDDKILLNDLFKDEKEMSGQILSFDVINDSLAVCVVVKPDRTDVRGVYNYAKKRMQYCYDNLFAPCNRSSLNGLIIDVRPDMEKIVMISTVFNQINVCDINGKNAFSLSMGKNPISIKVMERLSDQDLTSYFKQKTLPSAMVLTDDNIIVNYLDRLNKKSELFIFDWKGNLQKILQPDVCIQSISLATNGDIVGFVSDTILCRIDAEYI